MSIKRPLIIYLLFIAGVCLFAQQSTRTAKPAIGAENYRVYRGDGSAATLDDVIRASVDATVTFLGESHEDAVAHHLEERILQLAYRPELALSLEMFETDVQMVVDEYVAGLILEEHLLASGRAWRNYKSDYRPLVEFAKEKKLPVIAANAPRRYVNRVRRLGPSSLEELSAEALRFLPPLPYAEASPEYAKEFDRVMDEARKAGGSSRDVPFDPVKGLQAQSLWDAGMAFSIASFLTRNPGKRVLHCNGSFHTAARRGIPEHLARYRPGTSMLVITMMPSKAFPQFKEATMRGQGDFVIVTDPKLSPSNSSK